MYFTSFEHMANSHLSITPSQGWYKHLGHETQNTLERNTTHKIALMQDTTLTHWTPNKGVDATRNTQHTTHKIGEQQQPWRLNNT